MARERKAIRRQFRDAVFKRDGYTCKLCGYRSTPEMADVELDAHHITDRSEMPGGGYVAENGITLCQETRTPGAMSCHMKAEQFHLSGGRRWLKGLQPDDLYRMIGSSKEKAIEASKKLEAD